MTPINVMMGNYSRPWLLVAECLRLNCLNAHGCGLSEQVRTKYFNRSMVRVVEEEELKANGRLGQMMEQLSRGGTIILVGLRRPGSSAPAA